MKHSESQKTKRRTSRAQGKSETLFEDPPVDDLPLEVDSDDKHVMDSEMRKMARKLGYIKNGIEIIPTTMVEQQYYTRDPRVHSLKGSLRNLIGQ